MAARRPAGYCPRQTAQSDLCRIVREHLPSFIERVERDWGSLPRFVVAELVGLLRCGDFQHGFARLHCARCGDQLRVPFSCKGRGICPSCIGRRMSEVVSNWLDHLLPEVPYRQWVLSFDSSLAVRPGYDAQALPLVCRSDARRVMQAIRWRTKRAHGLPSVQRLHPGLITVVQRFRSDAGLYPHLHGLATDGAFERQSDGSLVFHRATGLTEDDLVRVVDDVAADLAVADLSVAVDVDSSLAACVQLSLSTPPTPSVVNFEPGSVSAGERAPVSAFAPPSSSNVAESSSTTGGFASAASQPTQSKQKAIAIPGRRRSMVTHLPLQGRGLSMTTHVLRTDDSIELPETNREELAPYPGSVTPRRLRPSLRGHFRR